MKIKYHGHSCFSVTSDNYTIVLDPYCGVNGFEDINLEANEVIASHEHRDHNYIEGVKLIKGNSPFVVRKISSYHDDVNGSKRGENSITVLQAEGKKVVHLGDLGHILDGNIVEELKGCDVLMIPVGGFFTIDIKQAIEILELIRPINVIPMHYADGDKDYDVLSSIDDFIKQYDKPCLLVKGYEQEIEI